MAISLRQTLAQLASHTHTYSITTFNGEANYLSFVSDPDGYANYLIPFNNPKGPPAPEGPVQTGPPVYPNPGTNQSGQ